MSKLDFGQKHILRLIHRDAGVDGWVPVSSQLYPHLLKSLPRTLVELELVGDAGKGRARLTSEGNSIIGAMEWL